MDGLLEDRHETDHLFTIDSIINMERRVLSAKESYSEAGDVVCPRFSQD